MSFNLDDYEPVASRVQRFYADYPTGAIHTEIVFDDGERVVIKATVWRNITDPMPAAIDYAEEILTDRGVNSTSRIENCATSATGRAISVAAHGLGPSDWTKKPSREEMAKVERRSMEAPARPSEPRNGAKPTGLATEKQKAFIRDLAKKVGYEANIAPGLTFAEASALIDDLKNGRIPEAADVEEPF